MEEKYIQQFEKRAHTKWSCFRWSPQKETYGYEILTENTKNRVVKIFAFAKEGTIYPILYRLTKAGLIQYRLVPAKANGGVKKILFAYRRGKRYARKNEKISGKNYKDCVDGFMKGMRNMNRETYIRKVKKATRLFRERKMRRSCGIFRRFLILEKSMEKAKARS